MTALTTIDIARLFGAPRRAACHRWRGSSARANALGIVALGAVIDAAVVGIAPRGASRLIGHALGIVTTGAFCRGTRLIIAGKPRD